DADEECDDGNTVDDDGCSDCVVDCKGPNKLKDPDTHHCYRYFGNAMTWDLARAACIAQGPGFDLAALSTPPEFAVVEPLVSGYCWLGGTDVENEGTFVWANGELWTYTSMMAPWAPAEPNNQNDEDCVAHDGNGTMNDTDCGEMHPYLCER